jgi:DNA-binding NarL/FixJ family response regulator
MRILLAHNLASERVALRRLLEQDPEFSVVGEVDYEKDPVFHAHFYHAQYHTRPGGYVE